MSLTPFTLPYSEEAVADLRDRLARIRWPDAIVGAGWTYGFDRDTLKRICHHWRERFDWKRRIEELSQWTHLRYANGDLGVHLLHARGKGPKPLPLLLVHGWPGSFLEMMKLVPLLTDPASHGADERDSFDVVVPSLPGFGFSDRPTAPGTHALSIAEVFDGLMTELGYARYGAHGGDFGAGIVTWLGLRRPAHVAGIHMNYIPGSYRPWLEPGELADVERLLLQDDARWWDEHGAYAHLLRDTPQTAAFGLNDSPSGLAAWILEKFRDWSDCDGDLEAKFALDDLLANVTLYWMTETIHSSSRMYFEGEKVPLRLERGQRVSVPCGIARFPKEDPFPPRAWVEPGYAIARWTEMPRGGHFPALEEPELLAEDIRSFFRGLR